MNLGCEYLLKIMCARFDSNERTFEVERAHA